MTSEVFVWVYLPGSAEPVVCGRFAQRQGPAGSTTGEFVYGASYLQRADAVAIDPLALPLRPHLITTAYLSGWFSVLLDGGPDDWGKRLIDRLYGPQDALGYLLQAHGQPIGALAFSADPQTRPDEASPPPTTGTLPRLLDLHRAIEAGEAVADEDRALLLQGTSAGGARPKTTVEDDGALWLAKFPSAHDRADQPPVPAMEAALLSIASACEIRVPRHRVITAANAPVLLVERFDRHRLPDGRYARRAYASARTLLWSKPEVQQYSFMGSYNNLARQMRVWERAPAEDIRELYRRIAFNCLVGNTDDHDRNTGFIGQPDGLFVLSPAFDLTARPRSPRMSLAMGFGADGGALTLANLLSESRDFGYSRSDAQALVQSQWETIHSSLVEQLVAHTCPERLAVAALDAMPGSHMLS
ncbi:MAG: HipA domain protein [Rhizobacter sp.]|nr:HipA domain protein [Rhizobacter sp.]